MSDAIEMWQPVPRFETRYAVSDQGRVYSHLSRRLLALRGSPNSGRRHLSVMLVGDTGLHQHYVHTLVLLAFVGPRPGGADARHLDGDARNNSLANLSWASRSRNVQDYKWHGKPRRLTVAQVRSIKGRLASGERQSAIARDYGVWPNAIRSIAIGRSHGDV